jgi:acyl-homoserine lactone acylase PvdQ
MTCKSGFKLADLEEFSFSEVSDVDIRKNSSACTIFWVFVTKLIKNTFEDEFFAADITRIPPEFEDFFVKQIYFSATGTSKQDFFDDVRTQQKETAEEIIYRSFVSAVSYLSANFGSEPQDWLWGRLAKMKLYHFVSVANLSVYDIGPFPIDLGPVAPAVAWIYLVTDDPKKSFIMTGGPSMRSVAYPDSSGVFSIEFAFPGGVAGFGEDTLTKPDKSSHFSDLIPTYFGGGYIKFGKFSRLDDMEKVFILVAEEVQR